MVFPVADMAENMVHATGLCMSYDNYVSPEFAHTIFCQFKKKRFICLFNH